MKTLAILLTVVLLALSMAGCDDAPQTAQVAAPQEPGADAIGHYCGMLVADHSGPKGQIFLQGRDAPIWFSSVRDTLAFTMLPEEPKSIAAIYVNDMGKAQSWQNPGPGNWVEAKAAHYVAGSDARGGMGAAEVVPFGDRAAAERFRTERGGEIFAFADVPRDYVLGGGDAMSGDKSMNNGQHHGREQDKGHAAH